MDSKVAHKINIKSTPQALYEFLMDVNNRSSYIPALEKVIIPNPPLSIGSQYIEVSRIAGRRLETTYELTDLQPGKRIAARTVKSIFPISVVLSIEEKENSCELTIRLAFKLSGIFRFGKNVVERIVAEQNKEILRKIKRSMEALSIE